MLSLVLQLPPVPCPEACGGGRDSKTHCEEGYRRSQLMHCQVNININIKNKNEHALIDLFLVSDRRLVMQKTLWVGRTAECSRMVELSAQASVGYDTQRHESANTKYTIRSMVCKASCHHVIFPVLISSCHPDIPLSHHSVILSSVFLYSTLLTDGLTE